MAKKQLNGKQWKLHAARHDTVSIGLNGIVHSNGLHAEGNWKRAEFISASFEMTVGSEFITYGGDNAPGRVENRAHGGSMTLTFKPGAVAAIGTGHELIDLILLTVFERVNPADDTTTGTPTATSYDVTTATGFDDYLMYRVEGPSLENGVEIRPATVDVPTVTPLIPHTTAPDVGSAVKAGVQYRATGDLGVADQECLDFIAVNATSDGEIAAYRFGGCVLKQFNISQGAEGMQVECQFDCYVVTGMGETELAAALASGATTRQAQFKAPGSIGPSIEFTVGGTENMITPDWWDPLWNISAGTIDQITRGASFTSVVAHSIDALVTPASPSRPLQAVEGNPQFKDSRLYLYHEGSGRGGVMDVEEFRIEIALPFSKAANAGTASDMDSYTRTGIEVMMTATGVVSVGDPDTATMNLLGSFHKQEPHVAFIEFGKPYGTTSRGYYLVIPRLGIATWTPGDIDGERQSLEFGGKALKARDDLDLPLVFGNL